jgi:hypothetical protein
MAPEQMELQQLAEQWHIADLELEEARKSFDRQKYDVEKKQENVSKLAEVLKTKVGSNLTHKLVVVDKDMGDHVLIEHITSAHGPYVSVQRLRVE